MGERNLEKNIYFIDEDGELETDDHQDSIIVEMREYQEQPFEGEIEKPPELQKFIEWVIPEIEDYLSKYETDLNSPTLKMIHLLPKEFYKKHMPTEGSDGFSCREGVVLNEERFKNFNLNLALNLIHEILHYFSFKKHCRSGETGDHSQRRSGLTVDSASPLEGTPDDIKLKALNEAITETLTFQVYINKIKGGPFFEDDVKKLDSSLPEEYRGKGYNVYPKTSSYGPYESLFYDLVKKIAVVDDKYTDNEDTKDVFYKAYFNGRLLPLARMLRKVDKDCLHDLAEIGAIPNNENLQKVNELRKKYGLGEDRETNEQLEKEVKQK